MPSDVRTVSAWRPTGERRHRLDWRGRLILQVQEARKHGILRGGPPEWDDGPGEMRWRDAGLSDLCPEVA